MAQVTAASTLAFSLSPLETALENLFALNHLRRVGWDIDVQA